MISNMKGPFRLRQINEAIFWIFWAFLVITTLFVHVSNITFANVLLGISVLGLGVYVADKLRKNRRFAKKKQ